MTLILSELDPQELLAQSDRRDFSKWWSLAKFRLLGLPTLDAALIEPHEGLDIEKGLTEFLNVIGTHKVLIRSDGNEDAPYPRGGMTVDKVAAISIVRTFRSLGRAVILMEPTNRYANLLSINVTVSADFSWVAEALGCGFDTSDLQRSYVVPEWHWTGLSGAPANAYVDPRELDGGAITVACHSDRVRQRLKSLANLHGLDEVRGMAEVDSFLKLSRNTCLFEATRRAPSKRLVAKVVSDALLVGSTLSSKERPFTIAYARLSDGRPVYWDISVGTRKWRQIRAGETDQSRADRRLTLR